MAQSIKFNNDTFIDASGIRIDNDFLSNNRVTITYIGSGVDSGAGERDPYFDFDAHGCTDGLYLVLNLNSNSGMRYWGFTIVSYCSYSGAYHNKGICVVIPTVLRNGDPAFTYNDCVITGHNYGWNSNIFVYKINMNI